MKLFRVHAWGVKDGEDHYERSLFVAAADLGRAVAVGWRACSDIATVRLEAAEVGDQYVVDTEP